MRIAYVINSLEGGGAALPAATVATFLREAGHQVRLFALARRDGRSASAWEAAGLDARVSPAPGDFASALWLRRELAAWRPDLIWTSLTQATLTGQALGALSRTPVVSWQHNAFLRPANLALLRASAGLTRLWVADCEAVAELTVARLRLAPGRVRVWPLMIARPPGRPPTTHRAGEPFRIGGLGRLHPNKGWDVLVEAMARLQAADPDLSSRLEVVIGGEGAERPRLESAIRAAGLSNLRLPGFQTQTAEFLCACHAYVQPSRAEGLCIAAHEAMAMGLPAIVSDIGQMPRTVREARAGAVVPAADAAALALAIASLAQDAAAAAVEGRRGQALVLDRYGEAAFARAGAEVLAAVGGL